MLGLMFGAAGFIIRSKADECVQEPGDAAMLLGIPELGMIPAGEPVKKHGLIPAFLSKTKERGPRAWR